MIDLRSDTITKPTPEMRRAMAEAEVGDDVLGDDPTVAALERRTCEILGKEAAVYMPSGTMSNQVAIRTHTEPGDEIILAEGAHLYFYESGAPAALSGVMCRLIPSRRGLFTADELRAQFRPVNLHLPVTKLVCLENTHNRGGGSVWPIDQAAAVAEVAWAAGLRLHLDGARLWNAAVAAGVPEHEYARHVDTVSVCFSKGLGAPVGSALAGPADFIARARRFRKQFGGGMRQAGIIAAGALYALDHHRTRLVDDHRNAKLLAESLAQLPGVELDPAEVETNIVILRLTNLSAAVLADRLRAAGVAVLATGLNTIRAVTSLAVTADDIRTAAEVFRQTINALRRE